MGQAHLEVICSLLVLFQTIKVYQERVSDEKVGKVLGHAVRDSCVVASGKDQRCLVSLQFMTDLPQSAGRIAAGHRET